MTDTLVHEPSALGHERRRGDLEQECLRGTRNANRSDGWDRRVACMAPFPFLLRGLEPTARGFRSWMAAASFDDLANWEPDVVLVNSTGHIPYLREYCDRHHAYLIGFRHGVANKYIGPDPEYRLTDYMCVSEWDESDFRRHGVQPLRGFLRTGNPWVDQLFRVPRRPLRRENPCFLFAPTYNPETSAAIFFGDRLVPAIRSRYPHSRIVIKPHPLMLNHCDPWVVKEGLSTAFEQLVEIWRAHEAADPNVVFASDPSVPISAFYDEADVLISDGSSLIFEFMALERPILLYTSGNPVEKWRELWDPDAPANRMRDAGMQFDDLDEFVFLLPRLFELHRKRHLERQRRHAQELYGSLRDGRSAERAQEAIAALPDLDIVLVARPDRGAGAFRSNVEQRLRNIHISEVTVGADPALTVPDNTIIWKPGPDHRLGDWSALVEASQRCEAFHASFVEPAAWLLSPRTAPDGVRCAPLDVASVRIHRGLWWQKDGQYGSDGVGVLSVGVNRCRRPWQRHEIVACDVSLPAGDRHRCTLTIIGDGSDPASVELRPNVTTHIATVADLESGQTLISFRADDAPADRIGPHAPTLFEVSRSRMVSWVDIENRTEPWTPALESAFAARERAEARTLAGGRPVGKEWLDRVASTAMEPGLPGSLAVLLPWIASDCRRLGARKVAMFTDGGHPRDLIPIWRAWDGPEVVCWIDFYPEEMTGFAHGLPVCDVDVLDGDEIDAVVFASPTLEAEMANACARWPHIPIYGPWMTVGTGPKTVFQRSIALLRRTLPFVARHVGLRGHDSVFVCAPAALQPIIEWIWNAWSGPHVIGRLVIDDDPLPSGVAHHLPQRTAVVVTRPLPDPERLHAAPVFTDLTGSNIYSAWGPLIDLWQ
jgi:CDP-glycerol glycerophosphotransferase (TagB/SpsB family)